MTSSTFIPPTPFLRHVARPVLRSPRTALQAKLSQQSSDQLAKLKSMKQNVTQRLHTLQSSSTSSTHVEAKSEHNESKQDQPLESSQPSTSSTSSPTTSTNISSAKTPSPSTSSPPGVILRYDVYLPWKSKSIQPSSFPPVETYLPHIDIFTKGGAQPPCLITPADQFYASPSSPSSSSSSSSSSLSSQSVESILKSSPIAEAILAGLNEQQREAVVSDINCACLVLAGPGSGKTRVLTHRIAFLITACGASPSSVLAVTFTNKAAAEMKSRVEVLLNEYIPEDENNQPQLTIGTFHWVCARLLRIYGENIGISKDFNICDSQDARSVVSRILSSSTSSQSSNESSKTADSAQISMSVGLISKLKNDKESELRQRMPRFMDRLLNLRQEYDNRLRSMNMLDFDDLLVETRRMLLECPSVLTSLQNRYQYVLVDEWQDTNNVQFDIVSLLTKQRKNLFVVGDVDQSIYKFRGADSGNMQRYTHMFQNAKQVMLTQNYRSSGNIISAAKRVIDQDRNRPKKDMITQNESGEKVLIISVSDGRLEAQSILSSIIKLKKQNKISSFSDCAIMYRTNYQSRLLEEACVQAQIPYLLQSGTRFFERKEIKDIVSFLRLLHNPSDDNAILRIINVPPRGIGKRTVDRIESFAQFHSKSIFQTIIDMINDESVAAEAGIRPSEVQKVSTFYELIGRLAKEADQIQALSSDGTENSVGMILTKIISAIEYVEFIQNSKENERENKIQDRIDNVEELVRSGTKYDAISPFLERVTLMTDAGVKSEENNKSKENKGDGAIWLTTLHGSKGLEFEAVFITGAEDGIIPLMRDGRVEDIEEERRLLYVGMTRAKQYLTISWRTHRFSKNGDATIAKKMNMSRFLTKVSGFQTKNIQRFKKTSASGEGTQYRRRQIK